MNLFQRDLIYGEEGTHHIMFIENAARKIHEESWLKDKHSIFATVCQSKSTLESLPDVLRAFKRVDWIKDRNRTFHIITLTPLDSLAVVYALFPGVIHALDKSKRILKSKKDKFLYFHTQKSKF